jgi:hypothetical protein
VSIECGICIGNVIDAGTVIHNAPIAVGNVLIYEIICKHPVRILLGLGHAAIAEQQTAAGARDRVAHDPQASGSGEQALGVINWYIVFTGS